MNDDLILMLDTPQTQELILTTPALDGAAAKIYYGTTEGWSQRTDYIPPPRTIIVYTDRNVIDGVKYAGVKLGDGTTYVVDLPFVGDDIAANVIALLREHVGNVGIHVTPEEKVFWNNKLNYTIDGEKLIFNRN